MDLSGSTILITGGCGLIGSTIADQLIAGESAGRIVILDNLARGTRRNIEWAEQHGNVELVTKDIRHFEDIRPHFEGVDVVFHEAAIRITACAEYPRECLEVLVDGSFNVVQACVEAGVKKLVAASSASIYGAAGHFPTDEDHHPYNNRTWYGAAKIANEGMYRAFHEMHGLPYVALRYFNVYGPRMDAFGKYTEVLIRWLDSLDRGERPRIFGDGKQTMDFVYSGDVAHANILAAKSDASDTVLNIGSSIETSLLDLLQALLRVTGHTDVQPEFLPGRKVNPVPRRLASTGKAAEQIGFRARVGLEEGLLRLVEWRRQAVAPQQNQECAT